MDVYKRLKIEFDGIDSTIRDYTGDGYICNYLNKLETAIETNDRELMLYCLGAIDKWYMDNIEEIFNNVYVSNLESHQKAKNMVHEFYEAIKVADPPQPISDRKDAKKNSLKKIFLSHCSVDKKYGDALRALLVGLGIKNAQLVYTSYPANKIPVGENIFDYLRENINSDVFVIILLSNNYLNSVACLNEMGGAWVVKSDYLCFYTPDFDFSNPKYSQCALDTRKMGAVLKPNSNCRTSMLEFKNIMCKAFELSVDEKTWSSLLDDFMEQIK